MARIGSSWIATHTGLPSFALVSAAGERVVLSASDGSREWIVTEYRSDGSTVYLSDALALPGVSTVYSLLGHPRAAVLKRGEVDWWRGLVSPLNGRAIPDLAWEGDGDGRSWDSSITRFNARIARWDLETAPRSGGGTFVLLDPGRVEEVWRLFQRPEPLLVFPGAVTPALPPRVITVDSVTSTRRTPDGWLDFKVEWTEVPLDSPLVLGYSGAPVVTWGEWDDLDGAWADRTYLDLLRVISGAPL